MKIIYISYKIYTILHQNYNIAKHWYSENHAVKLYTIVYQNLNIVKHWYGDFQYNEFNVFTFLYTPAGN